MCTNPWRQYVLCFSSVLMIGACATPATRPGVAPKETISKTPSPSVETQADTTATQFLEKLQRSDFPGAASIFDSTVKAALPPEKLEVIWKQQTAELGALSSWTVVQRTRADEKEVRVLALKFEKGELQALISITPSSSEIAGLFFKPVAKAASGNAPYVKLTEFQTSEMSVGKEPFLLKGSLTLPNGKGPFPAVVLVHGSGPNDRDETIGANKPFKDIAEGLSSKGIAVLRYDKRTFQYGGKLGNDISIDDEVVNDAVMAVAALKANSNIAPNRVFVAGHSLGALLAPEIVVRSGASGAILLAPPGRAPWDIVLAQMRYLEVPQDRLAEVEKAIELLKSGKLGNGKLLGAPAGYWNDWASRDGVAMAKKLRRPVLVLRGDRDYQVTEEDLTTWTTGLKKVSGAEITTIPGANHLFIQGSGKPGPAEYETPGHVDARVIEKLVSFISNVTGR